MARCDKKPTDQSGQASCHPRAGLTFAKAAIEAGYPEAAAAAVICFEWLQRPENVLAGYIRWTDYRGREAPTAIRIFHHKTGTVVLHPLQDSDGTLFYGDAEEVLTKVPRRGIPMILHETRDKTEMDGQSRQSCIRRVAWPSWFADCAMRPCYRRRSRSMPAGMVE